MIQTSRLIAFAAVLLGLLTTSYAQTTEAEKIQKDYENHRRFLPDFSSGEVGALGPFYWGRSLSMGEDARFSDKNGKASHTGNYLWTTQFMSWKSSTMSDLLTHGRNNFISRFPDTSFKVQPSYFILNNPRAHNFKIDMGYIEKRAFFLNGDNADLAHLASGDRVIVFIPVRHGEKNMDRLDQKRYFISPIYSAQSISVVEFKKKEIIKYEWFKENNLHKRILFDLVPHFKGDKTVYPGITHPIFKFDIHGKGAWTLKIERDGRDGLKVGENPDDWDMVFTHKSKGAKPYSVNITPENSAFALNTFSPGGSPEESSEALIGLHPYSRTTDKDVQWPDRRLRIRSAPASNIDQIIEIENKRRGSWWREADKIRKAMKKQQKAKDMRMKEAKVKADKAIEVRLKAKQERKEAKESAK